MEDKELKKRLRKIPDVDKNGEPIYKIHGCAANKKAGKPGKKTIGNSPKEKDSLLFGRLSFLY